MRHDFYEPQEGESPPMQIRGFQVGIGGTYVLMDDVITALRAFAQSLDDPSGGAIVHECASWLQEGAAPLPVLAAETSAATLTEPPYGQEADDVTLDVARIEVFPDPPEDPRPKWYARSVDTGGFVLKTTGGSYDQSWVIENAEQRWPKIPIHVLRNAGEDSKWIEDGTRGVFPSKGPPVRRLWAGASR